MKNDIINYEILHKCILYLLKCTANFCDEHNLKYCIDCGTLLGAIRDGHIIPWDDDGDICMPREDFDKFVETFNNDNKNKNICLQYYNTEERHNVPWCRIRLKGTTCLSHYHKECGFKEKGIWIGVFPYDHSSTNDGYLLQKRLTKIKKLQRVLTNHSSMRKTLKSKFFYFLTIFYSKKYILHREREIMFKYDKKDKNKYFIHSFISPKNKVCVFDNDVFFNRQTVMLDGVKFYAPTNTDKHLRVIYGENYITDRKSVV